MEIVVVVMFVLVNYNKDDNWSFTTIGLNSCFFSCWWLTKNITCGMFACGLVSSVSLHKNSCTTSTSKFSQILWILSHLSVITLLDITGQHNITWSTQPTLQTLLFKSSWITFSSCHFNVLCIFIHLCACSVFIVHPLVTGNWFIHLSGIHLLLTVCWYFDKYAVNNK